MFKYVLKRLGLSVIVLLGVSIIIYFLVRLMPTDYLENKFSAQIQQGTITIEQLDDFKKRYGLYMPEAYLTLDRDGISYEKDAKERKYKDVTDGLITYSEFYAGKYESSEKNIILEVNADGTWRILDENGDAATVKESGIFTADQNGITFQKGVDKEVLTITYTKASVWDKFVAVDRKSVV